MEMKKINTKAVINNLNLVFKSKDIRKLNKPTYEFLYLLSGFIAHYGFQNYYEDLRDLIRDLKNSSDVVNPEYYLSDFFMKDDKDYYLSKVETLKQIKPLIEKYEEEINNYFSNIEREEDINTIRVLMQKHNIVKI